VAHLAPESVLHVRIPTPEAAPAAKADLLCSFISGTSGTPIFPQFLKYHENPKFTVQQINLYPSGLFAIQAFSAVVYAWISDTVLKGRRWPILIFGAILNLITFTSLAAWFIPEGWKWACYYLAGAHVGLSGIAFT
jgi:MFS family permease